MDKKQLQKFIGAIGSIAETALLFYRSTLAAKATPEEAMRLTQAFIAAIFYGNKNSSSTRSSSTNSPPEYRILTKQSHTKRSILP